MEKTKNYYLWEAVFARKMKEGANMGDVRFLFYKNAYDIIAGKYQTHHPEANLGDCYRAAEQHFKPVLDMLWEQYAEAEDKKVFLDRMGVALNTNVKAMDQVPCQKTIDALVRGPGWGTEPRKKSATVGWK